MTGKLRVFVRNLTSAATRRRIFDVRRRQNGVGLNRSIALLTLASALFCSDELRAGVPTDEPWQKTTDIEATAGDYIKARIGGADGNTSIYANKLDPRVRLKRCDQPLQGFLRPGTEIANRTIVGVRCPGSTPWKVYIPVDKVVTATVLTPRRSLPRGHTIAAADLVADKRDVSRLKRGYFTRPEQLIGQKVRQSMVAGRIITPTMVEADAIIRRGQMVTLSVANARINIRMSGKALSDGALDQRIRVENSNSGRIVEGIVRSREHVEILTAGTNRNF